MNCVRRRAICTPVKEQAKETRKADTNESVSNKYAEFRVRSVVLFELLVSLMKNLVCVLLFNGVEEETSYEKNVRTGVLSGDTSVNRSRSVKGTLKESIKADRGGHQAKKSYLHETSNYMCSFFMRQYGVLRGLFSVHYRKTSILSNATTIILPCVKTIVLKEFHPISTYLLHNVLLSLTLRATGLPMICLFLYTRTISYLQIYFALTILMLLSKEKVVTILAQTFLVLHRFTLITPLLVLTTCNIVESYLNRKKMHILSFAVIAVPLLACMMKHLLNREQFEETDKYVIDRAVVRIKNYHGDALEGTYEIIKVHEEDDDEPAKVDEEERETNGYKIDETNNTRSDNAENRDLKGLEKRIVGTIRGENDDRVGDNTKDTGNNGREGMKLGDNKADEVGAEKEHDEKNQKSEQKQNKSNGDNKPDTAKKGRREQKHNNNPDSFIRQNELIRLKNIETSKFISSTTDKVDQKFYKIEMKDSNEQSFSLWRISNTNRNKEYVTARSFFKLKNANTNLMLGIRSDGMLNGSNESKITRQTFMITECTNHAYYKMVQKSEDILRMANEKTQAPDRVSEIRVDLAVNFIDFLKFCVIVCIMLLGYVLYKRYDFGWSMDESIIIFLVFLGCSVFLSTEFFAYVQYLTVLKLTKQFIVGMRSFVRPSLRKV